MVSNNMESGDLSGHIFIVIPAYNEAKVIGDVIQGLIENDYRNIIVVNDGSTDNTAETVKRYPVILLEHIINRGQGAALATGLKFGSSIAECRYLVTFDADGQHRHDDVDQMVRLAMTSDADIVLGTRFSKSSSAALPRMRKIVLYFATRFLKIIYGLKISDAHNGLRVIRKESALSIVPTTDDMTHASEIMYLIKRHGLKYAECPVSIIYTDYSLGKGQKTMDFVKVGIHTVMHKLFILFFDKE